MEVYANVGGDSGITNYEIGEDFIRVQFSDGSIKESIIGNRIQEVN